MPVMEKGEQKDGTCFKKEDFCSLLEFEILLGYQADMSRRQLDVIFWSSSEEALLEADFSVIGIKVVHTITGADETAQGSYVTGEEVELGKKKKALRGTSTCE